MSTTELIDLIKQLPDDKKRVVEDFVFTLASQSNINTLPNNTPSGNKKRMQFGDLKGFVTYISDDFDEPLEDFKDYM